MEVRSTQDGMLRAFHMLLTQQSKPRQAKPKYVYRPMGNTVHASRCLTKAEAEAVNDIVDRLNKLDPRDDANTEAINSLFKELGRHPVHFVPRKLAQRIDRSKTYPYRSTKRGD